MCVDSRINMPRSPPSHTTDLDSAGHKVPTSYQTMSCDEMSETDDLDILDDANVSLDDPLEKQRAALQVYLDSVPYQCESLDQMQTKLEGIVEKIIICGRSKSWAAITHWDGLLQWFVHFATVSSSQRLIYWQLVDDAIPDGQDHSVPACHFLLRVVPFARYRSS